MGSAALDEWWSTGMMSTCGIGPLHKERRPPQSWWPEPGGRGRQKGRPEAEGREADGPREGSLVEGDVARRADRRHELQVCVRVGKAEPARGDAATLLLVRRPRLVPAALRRARPLRRWPHHHLPPHKLDLVELRHGPVRLIPFVRVQKLCTRALAQKDLSRTSSAAENETCTKPRGLPHPSRNAEPRGRENRGERGLRRTGRPPAISRWRHW